jgi:hypothetical protein
MAVSRSAPVEAARSMLGLSTSALWIDYLALGGILAPDDLTAFLDGYREISDHEHDILVHSLNERFTDRDQDHPLAYAQDSTPRT